MPNPVAAKAPDPDAVLQDACSRSVVIEFHRQGGRVSDPAARARMLAVTDDALYVDEPQIIGLASDHSWDKRFDAYFMDGDNIFTFEARVVASKCRLKLNSKKTVTGMKLARPRVLELGQRRQFYRTSLALEAPVPMSLHRTDREHPLCTPITAPHYDGLLIDGSGGGLGVRIDNVVPGRFSIYDRYFVNFRVPGGDRLTLLTELRQAREIRNGDSVKLGLQILDWPNARDVERLLQPFTQHLNAVQRSKLKAG